MTATYTSPDAMKNLFETREAAGKTAIEILGRLENGVATFEGRFNGYISNPEPTERTTAQAFISMLANLRLLRRDAEESITTFCAADDSYRDGLRFWGEYDPEYKDPAETAAKERILDRHYTRAVYERADDVRERMAHIDTVLSAATAARDRLVEMDRSFDRYVDSCVDCALHDAFERRQFLDRVREADRNAAIRGLDTPEISRLGARARATYDSNRKDAEILLSAMEWRIRIENARKFVSEARTEKGRASRLEVQRQMETSAREVLEGYAERNALARKLLEEMYNA